MGKTKTRDEFKEEAGVTPKGVLLLAKCDASATLEGF